MIDLPLGPPSAPWTQLALIVVATFASEDLTCVAVGLLVRAGHLDPLIGLFGCFAGILAGDLGLWMIGRVVGLGLVRWGWLSPEQIEGFGGWFDRRGWAAVLAARFVPGLRLPLYTAAGVLGRKAARFLAWAALACLIWTPLLVLTAAALGGPITSFLGVGGAVTLAAAVVLLVRLGLLASTRTGRGRLIAFVSRLWRWEFWPSWLFYLPLLPWLVYLSLRHRGALVWTAANPGIPAGGVVGESKFAILRQLPAHAVVPGFLMPPGPIGERIEQFDETLAVRGWSYPLILKPDASERGAGVKKVQDRAAAERYLTAHPEAVIAQAYHPGPFEAGIFYYRLPGEETGRIFSVTDKVFPVLTGDGRSTAEELIWAHPRYRMQADVFLARHAARRDGVLAEGETLPLALAGNHCQGTMFRDGSHLITPELERAVDAVARRFDGFFIGRFDVRYTDPAAFRAGQELVIVELNGVTGESTNLYDPSWSLITAYRTLFRQWALLYRIGDANRSRGYAPTTALELLRLVFNHRRRGDALAD